MPRRKACAVRIGDGLARQFPIDERISRYRVDDVVLALRQFDRADRLVTERQRDRRRIRRPLRDQFEVSCRDDAAVLIDGAVGGLPAGKGMVFAFGSWQIGKPVSRFVFLRRITSVAAVDIEAHRDLDGSRIIVALGDHTRIHRDVGAVCRIDIYGNIEHRRVALIGVPAAESIAVERGIGDVLGQHVALDGHRVVYAALNIVGDRVDLRRLTARDHFGIDGDVRAPLVGGVCGKIERRRASFVRKPAAERKAVDRRIGDPG